jgi:flagellar hook assembly protein FlgD
VIEYTLPAAGRVHIAVYDVRGRQIAVLRDEFEDAGRYATSWNGRDSDGRRMASGTYFARIEAAGSSKTVKVVIAR